MGEARPDRETGAAGGVGIAHLFRPGTAATWTAGIDGPATSPPDFTEALDAAEERAAIAEYDGGLPRAEAEALALASCPCPEAAAWLRARWEEAR